MDAAGRKPEPQGSEASPPWGLGLGLEGKGTVARPLDGGVLTAHSRVSADAGEGPLLALLSLYESLRKRTETDVAFTLEYSRVSNPRGTIKRDQT